MYGSKWCGQGCRRGLGKMPGGEENNSYLDKVGPNGNVVS